MARRSEGHWGKNNYSAFCSPCPCPWQFPVFLTKVLIIVTDILQSINYSQIVQNNNFDLSNPSSHCYFANVICKYMYIHYTSFFFLSICDSQLMFMDRIVNILWIIYSWKMSLSSDLPGCCTWRPQPRLPSRAKHPLDADSWWHRHRSAPPPSDSHRQVLEVHQEQPGGRYLIRNWFNHS